MVGKLEVGILTGLPDQLRLLLIEHVNVASIDARTRQVSLAVFVTTSWREVELEVYIRRHRVGFFSTAERPRIPK
ncbi:hypothetical protein T440DRAFT_526532 [Plenodomus tracheiphilus IPT5]|uniref:Uncharacterized protein n=1 Tax=Plenodomus tracheiphilus IPT5 TaxID=1408161 RepID=A0A6A7ANA7_9PLEO|nr:hypothetical protein T440DRAFT_526532 [Plenodomus tracheiphilus IPT5]